jgi:formate hydrogenlyase subunit 3/multisubunit Na+/H+ antiporter MnhD subunit
VTALLIAEAVLVVSALGALIAARHERAPSAIAAVGAVIAAAVAMPAAIGSLSGDRAVEVAVHWAPPIGQLRFGLDPLSAFFVLPLLVLGAVCAIYGAFYLDAQRTRRILAAPACFTNVLVASMLLVLISRDAIGFIIAWELMTLSSYLLVVFDHAQDDVRRAGWIYLIASHVSVGCILSMFLLLGGHGLGFAALAGQSPGGAVTITAAVLGLTGFGVKAGIVPLHVWLPEAHAAAPSHVSALMSGVMIKLGIYGVLRTITFVPHGVPWGIVLIGLGVLGALVGISLAIYQRDLKRALAYSSVENIGVILIGLGTGLWGLSNDHPMIGTLGLCGGLFHIWNHVVMKALLFLGAGSVQHGAETRDIEQLGGLAKRMPRTAALMILGSLAIAALPPLNGFTSEWLIYLGLLNGGVRAGPGGGLLLLLVVAVLATVGVLAALSFVRIVGIALLGRPRSESAAHAHESRAGMIIPIALLAVVAVALSFAIPLLADAFTRVAAELGAPRPVASTVVDALSPVTVANAALWAAGIATFLVVRRLARRRRDSETWGCGYTAPTARMQYSGASFAEGIHRLLPGMLRARVVAPQSTDLFPGPARMSADRQDPFTRAAYEPMLDRGARRFSKLRWVQQGLLHLYILYVVLAVVIAIAIVAVHDYYVLP